MSYKSEFQANNVDLQGLIDTVKTLPVAENLDTELSDQDAKIAELEAILDAKAFGPDMSEELSAQENLIDQIMAALDAKDSEIQAKLKEANASWAGELTFSGTYADTTYYTAAGCSLAVDKQKGMAFVTVQGGTSTSYENIYFTAASLPEGVTLLTHGSTNYGTGGSTKGYYTAALTGITGKIDVAVAMNTRSATANDGAECALTVTYAQSN